MFLPPTSDAERSSNSHRKPTQVSTPFNDGLILIEVDDILEGGNERHHKLMQQFYSKFKCGKNKRIVDLGL